MDIQNNKENVSKREDYVIRTPVKSVSKQPIPVSVTRTPLSNNNGNINNSFNMSSPLASNYAKSDKKSTAKPSDSPLRQTTTTTPNTAERKVTL